MNAKKMVYAAVLLAAFSPLLVNSSLAPSIMVFAPLNYSPPNFALWGQWAVGGASLASIDPYTGSTAPLDANPGAVGAPFGIALTWFETGSYLFVSPLGDSEGSVHADIWLNYTITGLAGFRVYLWTYRWLSGLQPELWTSTWSDGMAGSRVRCADVGINQFDRSWPSGLNFRWTNGYYYMTRVLVLAFAWTNSRAVTKIGRYDQVVWNTYGPGDWRPVNPPRITGWMNPPMGTRGTQVTLNGTRFAPDLLVYVYYDDKLVAKAFTDGLGDFTTSFQVPLNSTKGPHIIKAIDVIENMATDFFDVFIEAIPLVGDLNGDGKIDIKDIALIAKQFGKTDPNVDPPEPTVAADASVSIPALASIAAVSVALFGPRKRKKETIR